MKRILIVKTSSLGDVIHNLPVVNDILSHHPDAVIDWVVEEGFADIVSLHPKVHAIHKVAIRRWRKNIFKSDTWKEIFAFKDLLSKQSYDFIIDTQGLIKSALITRLANGETHGYDKNSAREAFSSLMYKKCHQISYQQHAVIRNRKLIAAALNYASFSELPDYGISSPKINLDILIDKPFIIGLHGTSRDSKLWPQKHWIDLAKSISSKNFKLLLPWSNEKEFLRATAISEAASNAIVLPKFSLPQLAYLISNADGAIGVDTGLSHLTAALNIPIIAIYTDTDPSLTGVMAGKNSPATNLGTIGIVPTPNEVLSAMKNIGIL